MTPFSTWLDVMASPCVREDRIGRPLWEFSAENPKLGQQAILDFIAGGDPEQWRREVQDSSGRQALQDIQLLALRDAEGSTYGAHIVRQEVTEAVEQARKLEESLQLLATFSTVGHLVLASLDLEVIMETVAREIVKAGIFRSLTLSLVDEESPSIEVVRSFVQELGTDGEAVPGSALRAATNVVGLRYDLDDPNIMAEAGRTGELIITSGDDPRFDPRVPTREEAGRTCYFIPVKRGPRVVAVLSTGSPPHLR